MSLPDPALWGIRADVVETGLDNLSMRQPAPAAPYGDSRKYRWRRVESGGSRIMAPLLRLSGEVERSETA